MKKAYAKTVSPKEIYEEAASEDKPILKRKTTEPLSDQVAGSKYRYQSWYFPEGRNLVDREMRYVDKYYPMAEGGPLLVDEPHHADDLRRCQEKREILKKFNYRYLIIEQHSTFEDCLVQLGG